MTFRLIPYEVRKIFSSSFVKLLATLLLLLNIVLCAYSSYTPSYRSDVYYDAVYQMYLDDPQHFFSEYARIRYDYEHMDFFAEEPSSAYSDGYVSDISLFDHVYSIVTADDAYHEKIASVLENAKNICKNYEKAGRQDSYVYRYHKYVIERYTYIYDTVWLYDTPVTGWEQYFRYNTDFFIVFILITVISVYTATCDRSCGFYSIAGTCELGRARSAASKLCSAVILSSAAVVIFTVTTFVTSGIASRGYSDFRGAAQSVEQLRLLPLPLNLGGALAVDLILKLVSAIVFCAVIFTVSTVIKQPVLSTGAGIGFAVFNYAASSFDEVAVGQWKFLNMWSTYYIDQYAARYRSLDIFGHCVALTAVFVILCLFAIMFSFVISCAFYSKESALSGIRLPRVTRDAAEKASAKLSRRKRRRSSLSLVYCELYKQRAVFAVLAVLTVLKVIYTADYYEPRSTTADAAYKEYIAEIGGPFSEEKAAYLDKEYADSMEIVENFNRIQTDWWYGRISNELYNRLFADYMKAVASRDALKYLTERSVHLRALYESRGIRGSYVYDTGYYMYAGQGVDWLLLLFVAVLCCRSYLYEHTPILKLGFTTELGRGLLFRRKVFVCAISSAFAWLIFKAVDFFFLLRSYEIPDLSSSVLSIPRYDGALFNLTIFGYLIIITVMSLLGTLIIAALCFSAGLHLRRAIFAYASAAVVLGVPYLAASTGVTAAGFFDLTALYDTDRLYRLSPVSAATPVYGIIFGVTVLCAVTVLLLYSAHRIGKGDIN